MNPDRHVSVNELRRHLSTLGSPSVSTLVSLPLTRSAGAFTFGLDLEPFLAKIFGKSQPGTCLLGIRKLDGSRERAWIRIQVTDLCLTTVEAPDQVKFVVTSLSSGMPVYNARIRMEGMRKKSGRKNWEVILAGRTNSRGIFLWRVPGDRDASARYHIRRIVISKANDTLVLDPTRPPDRFAHNHWSKSRATWLQWTHPDLLYSWKLLVTVGISTAVWLTVTLLTPPTDDERLADFVRRVQPGSPGWRKVCLRHGITPSGFLGRALRQWVTGLVALFALNFGVGSLLLGRPLTGVLLIALAAAAGALLWRVARSAASTGPT